MSNFTPHFSTKRDGLLTLEFFCDIAVFGRAVLCSCDKILIQSSVVLKKKVSETETSKIYAFERILLWRLF